MGRSSQVVFVNGEEPEMGQLCTGFAIVHFYENGQITDAANCTYLCLGGTWYRLYFESSTVFWQAGDVAQTGVNSGFEHGTLLNDLRECRSVVGRTLSAATYTVLLEGLQTELQFSGGAKLVFRHCWQRDTTDVRLVS